MYIIGLDKQVAAKTYFSPIIEQLLRIDAAVYPCEQQGTAAGVYERCVDKETLICVFRGGAIVGYCLLLPAGDALYRDVTEHYLYRDDDILAAELSSSYADMFLLSVAILPEYQNSDVTRELREGILCFMREHSVRALAACAVSAGGVKFLKSLGAEKLAETSEGYSIMERVLG